MTPRLKELLWLILGILAFLVLPGLWIAKADFAISPVEVNLFQCSGESTNLTFTVTNLTSVPLHNVCASDDVPWLLAITPPEANCREITGFGDARFDFICTNMDTGHGPTVTGTVTVIANFATNWATKVYVIQQATAIADFSSDINIGGGSATVTFANLSAGATNYHWLFGQGTDYTTTNVAPFSHVYRNTSNTQAIGCS